MKTISRILVLCLLPALAVLLAATAPAGLLLGVATLTSCKVTASMAWTYETVTTGLTNTTSNVNTFSYSASTTNGTGAAGTADMFYVTQATIGASGNTLININSAPVKDFFGTNVVMARVKTIWISLLTTTTATSIAFGNAANPVINWISAATSTIAIYNNGMLLLTGTGGTQYAVTASTADQFKVLNNDGVNSATVQIGFVGSSA